MMSDEPQYTQIKRPVSRVAEKVLGWLNWIGLLLLTVTTMFIALVSFSNNTSIQNLEQSINNNDLAQQVLANNSLNTTQFVIWLQNGIWAVIVYLIVCLLISFLALISMNIRVLSGILFLVASIITLPLVLLLATIIIPVLFFIVAIMMFARKDRVETVPYYPGAYGNDYDRYDRYDREPSYRGGYYEEEERNPRYVPSYEKRNEPRAQYEDDEDDVKPYVPKKDRVQEERSEAPHQEDSAETSDAEHSEAEAAGPAFLSRQAKYKQKSEDEVKAQQENEAYEREQARKQAMDQEEQEPEEVKYRDTEPRKGETAEEKAARKREKKERKKRAKEARKNRPSAVNQRRMNFEERRSFNQGKTKPEAPKEEQNEQAQQTEQDNPKEKE